MTFYAICTTLGYFVAFSYFNTSGEVKTTFLKSLFSLEECLVDIVEVHLGMFGEDLWAQAIPYTYLGKRMLMKNRVIAKTVVAASQCY